MASGKCTFDDFLKLKASLEKLQSNETADAFIDSCAKELAARLLAKTVKRTPVGVYPSGSGKNGGTLRRGWTNGKSVNSYVDGLKVHHYDGYYVIEIVNPVEYASYVEFGHRTRSHSGWVEGKFMLTISEQEVQASAPAILEKKLKKQLGVVFK